MRLKGPIVKRRPVRPQELESRIYDLRGLLVLGIGVLVLVVLGWWGYRTWRTRHEEAGQSLLATALQAMQAPSESAEKERGSPEAAEQVQKAVQMLLRVRKEHSSTDAAEQALVQLGNAFYQRGQHQEAFGAYQAYLEQYPTGPWVSLAALGKAYALEAQQRYEEAAATFQTLADGFQGSLLTAEALIGLARCLGQLDRSGEVIAAYRRVMNDYPTSRWSDEAERALARIERSQWK